MKLGHALSTTVCAILLLGAPGPLLAQQDTRDLREIDDMEIVTADGQEIGEVEEVLIDASGQPVAVAVEVDDFLDLDDDERIIGLDRLRLEDDRFVTDLSRSEIEALPVWDD